MNRAKEAALKASVHHLFWGDGKANVKLSKILLGVNIFAVTLFLFEPMFPDKKSLLWLEAIIGIIFLAEYIAMVWSAEKRLKFIFSFVGIMDFVVMISLFIPFIFGDFGFIRVVRALRVLRFYNLFKTLSTKDSWLKRNEDVVISITNLVVFILIMADIVYVTQHKINADMKSYVDSLYFTLATLTTTGFGDITLQGQSGRLLAILIMVFGITLFVRLARDIIRPAKVSFECHHCGLSKHDQDAIHCKHCGNIIHIDTAGE